MIKKILFFFLLLFVCATTVTFAQNFESVYDASPMLIAKNISQSNVSSASYASDVATDFSVTQQRSAWYYVRRAEIITLGAMPFVTLLTSLGFSLANYISHDFDSAYSPNPFAKGANGFTEKEQVTILLTAAGISVGVGLTDFTVQMVKRAKAKKNAEKNKQKNIEVIPVSADVTATKLPPPKSLQKTYIALR